MAKTPLLSSAVWSLYEEMSRFVFVLTVLFFPYISVGFSLEFDKKVTKLNARARVPSCSGPFTLAIFAAIPNRTCKISDDFMALSWRFLGNFTTFF